MQRHSEETRNRHFESAPISDFFTRELATHHFAIIHNHGEMLSAGFDDEVEPLYGRGTEEEHNDHKAEQDGRKNKSTPSRPPELHGIWLKSPSTRVDTVAGSYRIANEKSGIACDR